MIKLDEYLREHYTKKTAQAYLREIEIYQSNTINAEKYTYTQIINHLGTLRTKYRNPKTINRILASIKAYYNYLCFIQIRSDNPSTSIRLRDRQSRDIQLQDLLTIDELENLLTSKKERYTKLSYRNKVLISLLIYQALKPNEIERIDLDEINLEQATIYIKSSAKNNSRTLSLKANQILLFKNYIEEIRPKLLQKHNSNSLIIGQRNIPMTAEDITKHITRNYNIYQPRKVNCLTIRQSVITNLLKQNIDLRIVQSFAGHKYPSTTERYKQTNVDELQTALKIYHPFK
jgi:integrase/recombinase XerD